MVSPKKKEDSQHFTYDHFDQVNGKHPLQKKCPDSFVFYKARKRHGGKVAFFNFDLAKEMGLIPKSHPNEMTKELEEKILETFSLVIINEYDIINKKKFPKEDLKENYFMATRYLQLQHPNKQGKTSGDGRSIWNGTVKNRGKVWDISSCGTGATRLSPATHLNNKFYETGDPSISYGCGFSEVDEGLATLFFSEVFERNNICTERNLGIIEFKKGLSINIRAHENLIRPSHMFNFLKQKEYDALENIVNYYIDRQIRNKKWKNVPSSKKERYNYFLDRQTEVFSKMAANFEDDYIFCWMDWDGDNILMDGGVIDFGSIRQFGLFHSEYRFDDVQRFSTNIIEQKAKARYTVQTFAQVVDYLKNKKRRSLKEFSNHSSLKKFDKIFIVQKNYNILEKIGFKSKDIDFLISNHKRDINQFKKHFSYFERAKSKEGVHKVSDGINWSAIFCMRDILRELPQLLLSRGKHLECEEFIEILKSNYATEEDLELSTYRRKSIEKFQKYYMKLISHISERREASVNSILLEITMRSSIINKYDRVTGDSITTIVDKIMKHKPRLSPNELYIILHQFVEMQKLDPDTIDKRQHKKTKKKLVKDMMKIVREYREGL